MSINDTRQSNFELLRIVSMFMIVVLHIGTHGIQRNVDVTTFFNDQNEWLYHFIRSLSIIAVNVYILLSGYFLSKSKSKFQVSKLVKLFLETSFFSLVVYLLNISSGNTQFTLADLKLSTFSVFYHEYWFISVYFVLYAFYPFLNRVLQNINKKEHISLLTIFFILVCVWEVIEPSKQIGVAGGYSLIYFIFLYVLAAYIRYYGFILKDFNKYFYLLLYIFFAVVNTFIIYKNIHFFNINWYGYNSIIVLLMSYFLFMFFKHINIKLKIINFSAYYVLGVYLIHEQHTFRGVLWGKLGIIENIETANGNYVILVILGYCLLVFISCLLLSIIIKTIFDKLYNLVAHLIISFKRNDLVNNS